MDRKITDLVLFVCFCLLFGSGILLYIAPKGIEWAAIGLPKYVWKYTHIFAGLVMFVALIAHLAINRKWIEKVGSSGRKSVWIILLIVGLLLISIPFIAPISKIGPKGEQKRYRKFGNQASEQASSIRATDKIQADTVGTDLPAALSKTENR